MNAAVMDALEAARGLEAVGVGRGQAEAMARMAAAAVAAGREDLATKADIAELKAELVAALNKMLLGQAAVVGVLLAAMAVMKFF